MRKHNDIRPEIAVLDDRGDSLRGQVMYPDVRHEGVACDLVLGDTAAGECRVDDAVPREDEPQGFEVHERRCGGGAEQRDGASSYLALVERIAIS